MFLKTFFQFFTVHLIIECSYGNLQKGFLFRNDYNYIEATRSFYKIHDTAKEWTEALITCATENADLLIVEDQNEADQIVSHIKETLPSLLGIFVGISDSESDGTFKTTDGRSISDIYNKWINGLPNITNAQEDCVEMSPNGLFDKKECGQALRFICKKTLDSFQQPCNSVLCRRNSRAVYAPSPKIAGGENRAIKSAPYQVYYWVRGDDNWQDCGGSIISEQYILTAAHCLYRATRLIIRAGSTDAFSGGQVYKTTTYFQHPQYTSDPMDYDVAVIKLHSKMTLDNVTSKIIQLAPSDSNVPVNADLLVTGWGFVEENGVPSAHLQGVVVETTNNEQCRSTYDFMTSRMFCAGVPEGGKDACKGDSGGPAVLTSADLQVGIVSFGEGCGRPNVPGLYTKVSAVRGWIRSITGV